jgi:hypothetical protein
MKRLGWRRWYVVLAVAVVLGLVALNLRLGVLTLSGGSAGRTATIEGSTQVSAAGGDLVSPDGTVKVHVPAGGAEDGTTVDFVMKPKLRGPGHARGAIMIGTPVDIVARTGKLTKGTVTLNYSANDIPSGLTDRQIGPAVFNPKLQAWIPLPGAKVDPASHTVAFPAPHFSRFALAVLDPGQTVQKFDGFSVKVPVSAADSLTGWHAKLVAAVGRKISNILTAEPVLSLACNPESPRFVSLPQSVINGMFKTCVETSTRYRGENRLRMWNHYGFPVLMTTDKGFWQRIEDIGPDADLVKITRSLFWMTQGKVIVEGADVTSMRFPDKQSMPSTVNGNAEWNAILVDAILAAAIVYSSKQTTLKAQLTRAWKVVSDLAAKGSGSVKTGEGISKILKRELTGTAALGWFSSVMSINQCLPSLKDVVALTEDASKAAVGFIVDCMGQLNAGFSALTDMIGAIRAGLSGAVLMLATVAHSATAQLGTTDPSKLTIQLEGIESEPGMSAPEPPNEVVPPAPQSGPSQSDASCLLTNEEASALASHEVEGRPGSGGYSFEVAPPCYYFDPNHTTTSGSPYGVSISIERPREYLRNAMSVPVQDIPPFESGYRSRIGDYEASAWAYTRGGIQVGVLVTGETWQVPTAEAMVLYLRKALARYKGE